MVGIAWLLVSQVAAQEFRAPEWSIKLSPISFMDPILPSAHLAVEWHLGKKTAVQLEGGPLLNRSAFGNTYYEAGGFRLRPSVRFYGFNNTRNAYTEIMFVARIANMDIDGDAFIEATSGASYYQRVTYGVNAQKYALLANLGGRFLLGGGFLVEYAAGVGVSLRMHQTEGIPENVRLQSNSFFDSWSASTGSERWLPEVSFYFNFGKAITYLPADR